MTQMSKQHQAKVENLQNKVDEQKRKVSSEICLSVDTMTASSPERVSGRSLMLSHV